MTDTPHYATLQPEWARQTGMMLTWPHAKTDWNYCLKDICETYLQMADAITRHEPLLIVTPEPDEVRAALGARLTVGQMKRIVFHSCITNDTWARDHGFITLSGGNEEPVLLDFRFNGWGEKFPSELDNAINRSLYDGGVLGGRYVSCDDFVLEGGSIEADGNSTVLTTSGCLLAPHRNQPMSREEIVAYLRRKLGVEQVLWIDYGHLEGDDTDGHIDTLVRTAPNNTLLYIGCDDPTDSHYADLKNMEEQLKTLRNANDEPYHLIKLPMPTAIYEDGCRLPATYANFVVLNETVIYPTYAQPENDARAAEAIQSAFPERELIAIDSRTVIRQHGSLHCCTMQLHSNINCSY